MRRPSTHLAIAVMAATLIGCAASPPDDGLGPVITPVRTSPPYNLIAVPLDHLRDGQVVHVEGHTFVAGETILVVQCAHEVLAEGAKACDPSTVVKATVDAHGAVAQSFTVHRSITVVLGADRTVVDCAERPSRCNISGSAATDIARSSGTGITFDAAPDGTLGTPSGSSIGATR